MVVKGIIKTIDFNSNTCTVRLPYFENAGNEDEVIVNAIFATIPGIYNGYKVDDIVFVDFEDNAFSKAVITGKLYLGASEEGKNSRSAFNVSNLTVDGTATIPITTKLSYPGNNKTTVGVENDLTTYKSLEDIARSLQKQETQIGSINAQFIDTGDSLGARIVKLEKDDTRHEAEIIANAEEISNKVSITENGSLHGLGWTLDTENWKLTRYFTDEKGENTHEDILTANENGLAVKGTIRADAGQIAGFTIEKDRLTAGTADGTITIQTRNELSYTPAAYIWATGSQYIDTGITLADNMDIEIGVEFNTEDNNDKRFISFEDGVHNGFDIYYEAGELRYRIGSPINNSIIAEPQEGFMSEMIRHTSNGIEHTGSYAPTTTRQEYIIDTKTYTKSTYSDQTLYLCARNSGSGATAFCNAKIYYCKIWRNGTLVRNFTPAFKLGVFGLWDQVTDSFFKSNSTTAFEGAMSEDSAYIYEINGTRYQKLDYIYLDGTNYIETNIAGNAKWEFLLKFTNLNDNRQLMGYDASADHYWGIWGDYHPGHTSGEYEFGLEDTGVMAGNKDKIVWDYGYTNPSISTGTINDELKNSHTIQTPLSQSSTFKFGFLPGSPDPAEDPQPWYGVQAEVYSIKCWTAENGLIRNFIPVKRLTGPEEEIGKIGFLDLIYGIFKTQADGNPFAYQELENPGGETFIDGTDTYKVLKAIESDGNCYIDTEISAQDGFKCDIEYEYTRVPGTDVSEYDFDILGANGHTGDVPWAILINNRAGEQRSVVGAEAATTTAFMPLVNEKYYSQITFSSENQEPGKLQYLQAFHNRIDTQSSIINDFVSNSLYLFARHKWESDEANHFSFARLYGCKIEINDTLVRNFIPVLKNGTDIGLYDTIEGKWYPNKGSGRFTAITYPYAFKAIYLGGDDPDTAPFWVTNTGEMYVKTATIDSNSKFNGIIRVGTKTYDGSSIAGFTIDNNALFGGKNISPEGGQSTPIGTADTVLVCTGSTGGTALSVGGSPAHLTGWNFTAGNGFGVRTDLDGKGELWCNNGHIGGVTISNNGLYGSGWLLSGNGAQLDNYTKEAHKKYRIIEYDKESDIPSSITDWDTWTSTNWKDPDHIPEREDGKYIWEWTKVEMGNDTSDPTTWTDQGKVCITGATGSGGSPGLTGRSVLSVTKYYKLASSTPAKPTVKNPDSSTGWSTTPAVWTTGNNYYESERTIYDSVDSLGNDFSWSDVVQNSMLTVDFINSLGIQAKYMTVTNGSATIFNADSTTSNVSIGGFEVDHNSISTVGKAPGDADSIMLFSGTNDDETSIGGSTAREDWSITAGSSFGVTSNGELFASNATIAGNINANGGTIASFDIISNSITSDTLSISADGITIQDTANNSITMKPNTGSGSPAILISNSGYISDFNKSTGFQFESIRAEETATYRITLAGRNVYISTSQGYNIYRYYVDCTFEKNNNGAWEPAELPQIVTISLYLCGRTTAYDEYHTLIFPVGASSYSFESNDVCWGEWIGIRLPDEARTDAGHTKIITKTLTTAGDGQVYSLGHILPRTPAQLAGIRLFNDANLYPDWSSSYTPMIPWNAAQRKRDNYLPWATGEDFSAEGYLNEFDTNSYSSTAGEYTGNFAGDTLNTILPTTSLNAWTPNRGGWDYTSEWAWLIYGGSDGMPAYRLLNADGEYYYTTVLGATNSIQYVCLTAQMDLTHGHPADGAIIYRRYTLTDLDDYDEYCNDYFRPVGYYKTTGEATSSGLNLGNDEYKWNDIYSINSHAGQSDRTVKKDIIPLSEDLFYDNFFDSLTPVSFKFKDNSSNRTHTGFIAQDVEDAIINNGKTTKDFAGIVIGDLEHKKNYFLRYSEFIALNTLQIQKLKARVSDLESTIQTLQTEIEELKNK